MKKLSTLFALLAAFGLQAQITVTNASFPAVGDTLRYATDLSPEGVAITPPGGGPATWDFTSLTPTVNSETVFRAAAEGSAVANFPTATLFTAGAGGQNETYFAVSATSFDNLGFFGVDPTGGLPVPTTFYFSPPVAERRAPMNFFDINQSASSLNIAFALADLGPLADSLGPIAGLADSIRVRGNATRLEVVDAHGTLAIPGGTYDVLRQKRTEYRETRLDIHLFIGWIDVTDQVIEAGGGVGAGFGTDTLITYLFVSDTEKEIIANVNTGSDGLAVQSVEYKDNGIPNAVGDALGSLPQVLVSPNPASSEAVFSLKNFAPGSYTLHLLDARGSLVLVQKLKPGESTISLETLSGGTYFYQVFDEKNRATASGKLVKTN